MRPTLFRTEPILIDGTDIEALQVDLSGQYPVTLYMENMDIAGKGQTMYGAGNKNGNVLFTAAQEGSLYPYTLEVILTVGEDQEFSTEATDSTYTINLECDAEGVPTQSANDVIDLVNADPYSPVIASLAPGSDGSARMDAATVEITGDSDATTTGTAHVYHGPTADGPWDESSAAGTAFSAVAGGVTKAFLLDSPVRGLRVTVSDGGQDTYVVFTAVRAIQN